MKRKEIIDIRSKPVAELEKTLAEWSVKLRGMEFDLAAGKTANVKDIRTLTKDIARLHTIIGEAKRST
jgi:ribosomal protein L29